MKHQIFTFKISLDAKTYRMLAIEGSESLAQFAEEITKAFAFNFDHPFGFYDNTNDIYESSEAYELFFDEEGAQSTVIENAQSVKDTTIADVFVEDKNMMFLFDYGNEWNFLVECIAIEEPQLGTPYPTILTSVGAAPEQYPDEDAWDDEEDEEQDEDDNWFDGEEEFEDDDEEYED